jgi:hypothetical protein
MALATRSTIVMLLAPSSLLLAQIETENGLEDRQTAGFAPRRQQTLLCEPFLR